MEHRVKFRKLTLKDLGRDCRFVPDEDEFEMHSNALVNDVEMLEGVTGLRSDGPHAIVITTDDTLDVLKQRLSPLLQNHWAYLRIEL